MRVGVLLSVRDKSTRFPGKVMKKVQGKSMTELLVERLKMAKNADEVIIATSDDPRDKVFEPIAEAAGVKVFFGDQDDKLKRYYDAAVAFDLDLVVVVDGDDTLCFPEYIDKTIELLKLSNCDAAFTQGLPLGAASSGLTKEALGRVLEVKLERDTEVWGGYFIGNKMFNVNFLNVKDPLLNHPQVRLTLDYEEDFDLFAQAFDLLYPNNPQFSSHDLMRLLVEERPEMVEINKVAQQKYEAHISNAAPVRMKEDMA